jgi:hypothetical protein
MGCFLQEFIADVVDLNPEYAVSNIILELLQSESLESQLIALKALTLVSVFIY